MEPKLTKSWLITIALGCLSPASVFAYEFNTLNSPDSGGSLEVGYLRPAQSFTTDVQSDLTLRHIEFNMNSFYLGGYGLTESQAFDIFQPKVVIQLYADVDGLPNYDQQDGNGGSFLGRFTASMVAGNAHYTLDGAVVLAAETKYWALFFMEVLPSVPRMFAGNLSLGQPGVGSGNWFQPSDGKSLLGITDLQGPSYWQQYSAPIKMAFSTVPEPSGLALFLIAAGVVRFGPGKSRP